MKKVLSLLLSVALLATILVVPVSADAKVLSGQRIELTAPSGEVNVGDKIEIPATISNPNMITGVVLTVSWDPTLLKADPTFKLGKYNCFTYPKANDDGVSIQDAMKDVNVNDVASGKMVYAAAAGYAFEDYTTPLSAGTFKFEVLEAAAGKNVTVSVVEGYQDAEGNWLGTYTTTDADGNVKFDTPVNASFKVAGGEPEVPTAETIGLSTAAGEALVGPINVKNNDGSEYTINSALAFVSCVDTAKATPVKTVITRADSDKVLTIEAKNKTEIGEKTYFVAAVSSIKDSSFGKVFTAKAYAQAGEYEVEGAEATGTYAE